MRANYVLASGLANTLTPVAEDQRFTVLPSCEQDPERELHRVFTLNQALRETGTVTLGDLVDHGLATVAGNLSMPCGYWSCPWCWMDYERPGYRPPNV